MDQTVTATVADLVVVLLWAGSVVAAWFLGGYYKSRRVQGMTKDEIKDEAETITKAQLSAWGSVIMKEIQSVKDKLPK
jgi:hypothetical protein